jgi:DNA-binding transcriptional regulator YdaS (Cro superfamily)
MPNGMDLIRAKRGMLAKIAHDIGQTRAAVAKWKQVPAERVVEVERITGIPREKLRPDLFRRGRAA